MAVFPTEECEFNGYSFTSLPEAIEFYTENRLQGHYLSLPVRLPPSSIYTHKDTQSSCYIIIILPCTIY